MVVVCLQRAFKAKPVPAHVYEQRLQSIIAAQEAARLAAKVKAESARERVQKTLEQDRAQRYAGGTHTRVPCQCAHTHSWCVASINPPAQLASCVLVDDKSSIIHQESLCVALLVLPTLQERQGSQPVPGALVRLPETLEDSKQRLQQQPQGRQGFKASSLGRSRSILQQAFVTLLWQHSLADRQQQPQQC